ncbi:MAG: hypothetical protein ACJAQ9_002807 [Ilumatobacter sp.]|jgi:hypothetical protein
MINKLILSSIAIVAMTLGAFAPSALAQDDATPTPTPVECTQVGYNLCIAYPQGGFGDSAPTAAPTATPRPTSAAVVSADAVDTTVNGASIAFTGAESRVLGYAGAGLIGVGAIAVAVARRKSNTDLD